MAETDSFEQLSSAADTFLSTLSIKHTDAAHSPEYWDECWEHIKSTHDIDPAPILEEAGPMDASVVDLYFIDEETAQKFLSADALRLKTVLIALATHPAIPSQYEHAAETGGGPGIALLWLASQHPDRKFTVYDAAEKPLAIGRLWAEKLGLSNISYIQADYKTLSGKKYADTHDLVLGISALNLLIKDIDTPHLSVQADINKIQTPNHRIIKQFASACSNCLTENGSLYFSQGNFNDLGIFCFFNALRLNKLGVDWAKTTVIGDGEGSGFSIKEIHILIRPAYPSPFPNAREDVRTFFYAAKYNQFSLKTVMGFAEYETYLHLLKDGVTLAKIETERENGDIEQFQILAKGGLLGFFSASSAGSRAGFIYSASSFDAAGRRLQAIIGDYKQKQITVTKEEWHPVFDAIIAANSRG